jgi:hypothetical protein
MGKLRSTCFEVRFAVDERRSNLLALTLKWRGFLKVIKALVIYRVKGDCFGESISLG